jgi:hypothetical protein
MISIAMGETLGESVTKESMILDTEKFTAALENILGTAGMGLVTASISREIAARSDPLEAADYRRMTLREMLEQTRKSRARQ